MSSAVLTVNAPGTCVFCSADSSGDPEVSDPVASPVTVTSSVCAGLGEVSAGCGPLIPVTPTATNASTLQHRHIEFPLTTHEKLLHKSPPVSLVTERLVKFVCVLSRKPCIQSDAPDSSLGEIFLGSRHQRTTNSAALRNARCHKRKDPTGRVVMFIGWTRERANHATNAAIHDRDKGLVGWVRQNQLQARLHFCAIGFIAELAYQHGKLRRVIQFRITNAPFGIPHLFHGSQSRQ